MSADKGLCFTTKYNGKSSVLQSEVKISSAIDDNGKPNIQFNNKNWKGLWDTGATKSLITANVAKELDLKVVSKCYVSNAHGTQESNCYYVNIALPNRVVVPNLLVVEGTPNGCDLLIGMDVIGIGDFAVSNYNNLTTFTFRVPSKDTIDFVEHTYLLPTKKESQPGRNTPCPCGSGKKYKYCCGSNK